MRISPESTVSLHLFPTYFAIAHRHYKNIEKYSQMESSPKTEGYISVSTRQLVEIQKAEMITVVFSAFTLEALINYYAMSNISKRFFKDHLDKLSPSSKWVIIPKLILNEQIPTDQEAYTDLKWLFDFRNKLAHSKGEEKTLREMMKEDSTTAAMVAANNAKRAIDTVKQVVNALQHLDSQLDIDWLTDVLAGKHI